MMFNYPTVFYQVLKELNVCSLKTIMCFKLKTSVPNPLPYHPNYREWNALKVPCLEHCSCNFADQVTKPLKGKVTCLKSSRKLTLSVKPIYTRGTKTMYTHDLYSFLLSVCFECYNFNSSFLS